MRAPRPCSADLAYDTSVKATLRTTLGWLAAVLINVGVVAFALGLLLPRVGGNAPVLVTGIALLVVGVAVGAAWMFVSRHPPR